MTTIDMEPQSGPSGTVMLREFWSIGVRRKWAIISSIILSLTAAATFCALATKYYRSEALILVEEQKISQEYVKGVVDPGFEERFFAIQKQIMSRQLLGEIIDEFKLYPDIMEQKGPKAALTTMTKAVAVEMIDKVPGAKFTTRKSVDAFTISFSYPDPTTATEVTSRIASKFIEDNLKAHEQLAEGTTEFFDTELARTKSELERTDDEVKRFKSKHMGQLPEQVAANLSTLDRLQNDLKAVNETIQRLSDRIAMVDRAMQEFHKFGTTNGALIRSTSEPDPLYRRLKELKEKLVRLRAEFWEGYPEVLLTKEEIRQVELELMAVDGPNALKPGEKGEKPLDPYLQDLKKQESEAKSELAVLKQRQDLLHAEKKVIEARVAKAPAIEQELQTLMRDYENMKGNYQALLGKRLNALVGESLEKRQKGAQFRILDPATVPIAPEWPNIPLILVVAFLFGGTVGVGIAVIQEQQNPQFRRPEDVEQAIGLRVLAVIPDFTIVWNPTTWKRFIPYYRPVSGRKEGGDEIDQKLIAGPQLPVQGQSGLPFESNIIVKHLPKSIVAEQYRVAATRLALDRIEERSTIVCVTSAVQGEGKTTTVVNLGYTFARDLGRRTVLVDCDFKRPSLNRYAENASVPGLADCLRSGISVDDCLFGFPEVPCWIMPVGKCEDESNELLKANRLSGIFDQLRDRFEYIFINAPPILPLADMNVITGYVDVLLLVVRAASTPQHYVKHALNTLMTDKPIHLIFNAARGQNLPSYFHDYYMHSYKKKLG
jgi:polysaccharide chain length determinant protein (PEP-CTERM system associated)